MRTARACGAVGVAVSATLVLAACGSGGSSSDDGQVTITYATGASDDLVAAGEAAVIKAFEKVNPDIKVKIETIDSNDYETKIQTELRGGAGPDLGRVNHTNIQIYDAAGFLYPLNDAISSGEIDTSPLIPGLVDVGKVDDDQVTLPLTTDARVLYVNTKMLKSRGIATPPTTWTELVADVKAFAGTGTYGYGFSTENDYALSYESAGPYINTAGGAILNAAGDQAVASQGDATASALQLLQDIVATKAVPPGLSNLSGDSVVQLFAKNKLAIMLGGPWVRATIEKDNPDLAYGSDWVTVPTPVRASGDKPSSASGGWQLGVFKGSKHKDAAVKLLAWIEKPENLETINKLEAFPPTSAGLDAAPWKGDPFYDAFKTVLPNAHVPITPVPRMAEVSAAFEKTLVPAVIKPGSSIPGALSDFDQQADGIIK